MIKDIYRLPFLPKENNDQFEFNVIDKKLSIICSIVGNTKFNFDGKKEKEKVENMC